MGMIDKAGHIALAAEALAVFQKHCGTGDKHAIADLICDLGHLADERGFDFLSEVKRGIGYWYAEHHASNPVAPWSQNTTLPESLTAKLSCPGNVIGVKRRTYRLHGAARLLARPLEHQPTSEISAGFTRVTHGTARLAAFPIASSTVIRKGNLG
jgi:hypothetical protein